MAGRPTKYHDKIIEMVQAYIEGYESHGHAIPSIAGLSLVLDVNRATIYEWAKENKEFSDMLAKMLSEQEQILLSKGLSSQFNAQITKLVLAKHNYHEKVETKDNPNMGKGDENDAVIQAIKAKYE